jgi:hypothetical protein
MADSLARNAWDLLKGGTMGSIYGGSNTVAPILDYVTNIASGVPRAITGISGAKPSSWMYKGAITPFSDASSSAMNYNFGQAKKGLQGIMSRFGYEFPTPTATMATNSGNDRRPMTGPELLSDPYSSMAIQRYLDGTLFNLPNSTIPNTPAKPSGGGGVPGGNVSVPDENNNDIMGQMLPIINRALGMNDQRGAGKSMEMITNPNYYTVEGMHKHVPAYIPRETEWQYGVERGGAGKTAAMTMLVNELLGNRSKLAQTKMSNDAMIRAHQISSGPGYINANNETRALNEMLKNGNYSGRDKKEEGAALPPMYRGF